MAYVPMNRARALIICTRPQGYAPSRVYAAACYLEAPENATAEELGLAKMAHIFLQQARRELPERKPEAEAVRVKRPDRCRTIRRGSQLLSPMFAGAWRLGREESLK